MRVFRKKLGGDPPGTDKKPSSFFIYTMKNTIVTSCEKV